MIFDQLSECQPYRNLGENFIAGFDYLCSSAIENIPDGRYPIVGDDVFAMVQSYQTKPLAQGRWEAHRHYADIQYIVSGTEQMGIAPLSAMTIQQPYTRDKDLEFFLDSDGIGQFVCVESGFFAIFLPQDVHMPGVMIDQPAAVKKIVVKVRIA